MPDSETAPVRIRWMGESARSISGYTGTINIRVFQIWKEESRWVLTSALPGQFTMVSVDEDPEPLKHEAEDWLALFASSLGVTFPAGAAS